MPSPHFRTAPRGRVLAGFGRVFRVQHEFDQTVDEEGGGDFLARGYSAVAASTPRADEDDDARAARFYKIEREADAFYAASRPSAVADCFISHTWRDSPTLKHLALLYYANLPRAIYASWAVWLLLVVALLSSVGFELTALGGTPWLKVVFATGPPATFFATFFWGHELHELLFRPSRWWLDKLCIHQRRSFLKVAGIRAIPLCLERSSRLVVLHGESYFSRLWCSYEVATFLASHAADDVDIVPLWIAPWVLAVVAIDVVSSMAAILLVDVVVARLAQMFGVWAGALTACTLVSCLAYAPMALPIVIAYRAKRRAQEMALKQLEGFSLGATECSVEADRVYVERHVSSLYGGPKPVETFERAVRTDVLRLAEQQGGGCVARRMPFKLAALPFMPLAWNAASDVLGCDGRACAEAAAINGFADARVYVVANAVAWLTILSLACNLYPSMLWLLRRTERVDRAAPRLAASVGVVFLAYGLLGFLSGVASGVVFACLATGGLVASAALAAFLASLATWNVWLFRFS